MKSIICIALLMVLLFAHPSLQCNSCKNKCNKCCKSGEFRLVPLYELYDSKNDQYFYTVSLREKNSAIKERDFVLKKVVGLAAVGEVDCKKGKTLVPVKRYINKDISDYLYQTEDDAAHFGNKYTIEGVAFYGTTTANNCGTTIPIYRFWNGKNHIYSTDMEEGKERAGKDGVFEALITNIWPLPNAITITTSTTTTTTTTTTRDPLDNPGSCSMKLTKLFRLYRNSTDSFLFTPSYDEAKNAYETQNYNPQQSPGYAAPEIPSCRCNLVPLYRVDRAEPKQDQLLTTNKKEADDAVSGLGYTDRGISYYCSEKANHCGASVPYYRYKRNNVLQNHFYTTNTTENTAVQSTYNGILCYIWPQQN